MLLWLNSTPVSPFFGSIGYNNSNQSGSWLDGSDPLGITIGPSFSWKILNYGRIKNQIRLQDAVFEESLLSYNKTVISAATEVANALEGYLQTLKQHRESKEALNATIRAFNISAVQYNDELVNYQRLLTTVEKLTNTQDRYASIKGNIALNAVALYKSLGGGWQISRGHTYLSNESIERMKSRVNWGRLLEKNGTILPKGLTHEQ